MKNRADNLPAEGKASTYAQPTKRFPFSGILLIAGWIGLLTGLAEAIFLVGWRQIYRSTPIFLSSNVIWMAPLAEMLIFAAMGGILALFHRQFPRFFKLSLVFFILVLASFMALLLLLPQLHIYAKWALAAGIAFQTARFAVKYQSSFYGFVRRSSVWLIAVVVLMAFGMLVRDFVKERASVAKLPPAAQNAPNVLLITMDTVRAENLSLYGYERDTTPQLKKLAKDGVVFEQAIAPSSWTLPSHAGIFTGMSPNELSFGWNRPLKPSNLTLAEALGQKGYESAGFAANLLFCTKEIGIGRGMIHYEDYPVSAGQTLLSASLGRVISNSALMRRLTGYNDSLTRKNAETINDDFLRWLSSRGQNRPFFAFLNYFDAHEPLLPPAPFSERFGPAEIGQELFYQTNGIDIKYNKKHDWSEREALKYRNAYDNSIVYLDQKLGELFAELSERGILENTVVIVTSDHGELLGERGLYGHGSSLYAETLRVPLLIRFPPRMPKDARVRNLVGLLDLPATVLDLTGDENQTAFPGSSLRRFFDERPVGSNEAAPAMIFSELRDAFVPSWYPGSKGDMQSLMTEQYHYIHNGDGKEELYDRKADPKELNDLAKSAEAQKVLEEFRNDLKKYPSP